jgi:amino-acid N-acetyltransferase
MLPKMASPETVIAPARAEHLAAVLDIVHGAALPVAGIAERFPNGYVVARSGLHVVAVAGLEIYGEVGLLRSVAVRASMRGAGLGRLVVEDRLRAARAQGLGAVYLLTTTAADYFRRLGFRDSSRSAAPETLQRSSGFTTVCPASAVCLAKIVA